jgi:thiol peroxidase
MSNLERKGLLKLGAIDATVIGTDVSVGQMAPAFTVSANDWKHVDPITDGHGKVRILAAVPSLDTNVCDKETRMFNVEASKLSDDILVYVISTDMPMTQKKWCGNAGVERVITLSDVLNTEFGLNYGLLIKERRYLRRAVFVIDRNNNIVYADYMKALGEEPNYADVLNAAKTAL